jgi:uncharacterized protein with FMN-binding domain
MIKYKALSFVGFTVGAALVLFTYPPTLFDDGLTDVIVEIEPTSEPTPSPSATSSATVEPTASITAKPTASATPSTSPSATPSATPTVTKTVAPATTTKTLIGNPYVASKYGTVQVQIVVSGGVITSAKALLFPDADSRSSAISATAIPILIQQTLKAQNSSDIQGATGASYTSAAWIDSLQSALAKM